VTVTMLQGGLVVDGSGAGPVRADVVLDGAVVVAVGPEILPQGRVIDVSGRYILPGFVDPHVHALPLLGPDREEIEQALLSQGVTSVILGGDGVGPCPGGAAARDYAASYFLGIDGPSVALLDAVDNVQDLMRACNGTSRINIGYLVPAGTVRQAVLPDTARPANDLERGRMAQMVEQAMDEGALGLATGLEYVPGAWATAEELATMCRVVARADGVHASHMRHYEAGVDQGIAELADVAHITGVRTHVAHLRAPSSIARESLDAVEAQGVRITFDSYPYVVGCTLLAMRALPRDLQSPAPQDLLARISDKGVRTSLHAIWSAREAEFGQYRLAGAGCHEYREHEGMTLGEAAAAIRSTLPDYMEELIRASAASATCLVPAGGVSDETDMTDLLRDARQMACSDGIYVGGKPHPRGWGAFAKLLQDHVGEGRAWDWGQAAWHLSGHACERFGLARRGRIESGRVADLVVLDPDEIRCNADFRTARNPASGVERVFVSGTEVFAEGLLVGSAVGNWLHRGRC
jgi:N-acyl-D-amino-acid deacylase